MKTRTLFNIQKKNKINDIYEDMVLFEKHHRKNKFLSLIFLTIFMFLYKASFIAYKDVIMFSSSISNILFIVSTLLFIYGLNFLKEKTKLTDRLIDSISAIKCLSLFEEYLISFISFLMYSVFTFIIIKVISIINVNKVMLLGLCVYLIFLWILKTKSVIFNIHQLILMSIYIENEEYIINNKI